MAQALTISGKVSAPLEEGQTAGAFDLAATFNFTQRASFDIVYDEATVDDVLDFGSLTDGGAKMVIVKCTVGAATIKFNGEALAVPLVPGAYLLYCNPSGGFFTSALVTTAGAATVKLLALA